MRRGKRQGDTRQSRVQFLFLLCFRGSKQLEESRILSGPTQCPALCARKPRIVSIDCLMLKHSLLSININVIYHESLLPTSPADFQSALWIVTTPTENGRKYVIFILGTKDSWKLFIETFLSFLSSSSAVSRARSAESDRYERDIIY